jgi:hypothetical protein
MQPEHAPRFNIFGPNLRRRGAIVIPLSASWLLLR